MGKNYYLSRAFLKRLIPVLTLALILYTFLEAFVLYSLLINQIKDNLQKKAARVSEDVVLNNGGWDISAYKSDNQISDKDPIYIITSEGFVVERSKPIKGLLDLSRYSALDSYTTIQTLTTPTNEKWRVYSVPLVAGEKAIGIIMVAVYNFQDRDLPEVDKQIQDIVAQIRLNLTVSDEFIDTSKIDIRKIPFDTSFQIVSRFNKVLLQSQNSNSVSNIPSFIDRSYVDNQLKGHREKLVNDSETNEGYLTLTTPVLDNKQSVAGVIVVGESTHNAYWSTIKFSLLSLLVNLLITVIAVILVNLYMRNRQKNIQAKNKVKLLPKSIVFMKKSCKISVDGELIDIPYASFQFYFCDSLFSKPKKRWEVDELLEIFGEDFGVEKWRKIYDTMVALNKKTSGVVEKLFAVKDKRYFINPKLISMIEYANS